MDQSALFPQRLGLDLRFDLRLPGFKLACSERDIRKAVCLLGFAVLLLFEFFLHSLAPHDLLPDFLLLLHESSAVLLLLDLDLLELFKLEVSFLLEEVLELVLLCHCQARRIKTWHVHLLEHVNV